MRFEESAGISLPKVGFGTWGIGGRELADPRLDKSHVAALLAALELGYAHFDTAEVYAAGHAEELLARALRAAGVEREHIFITSKVSPEHLTTAGVAKSCEGSLRRLRSEYLDLYLIHWPNPAIRIEETFAALNALARAGKVRHLGVSNFDLTLLGRAQAASERPLLTNQVPYSFSERTVEANGVLDYCRAQRILLTAYSPVKRLSRDPALESMAASRSLTAAQVAIAWVCSQPGVITIPKAVDLAHQRHNFAAGDVLLTPEELRSLG